FTVPADKGDARNLTHTPRVAERDPAWSPDGKSIAFFSDESGEYELHIVDQSGLGAGKKINLGNPPSFFYAPLWSPDSKKIAYTDKRLNLWYVDLEKGMPVKVTTDRFDDPTSTMNESWIVEAVRGNLDRKSTRLELQSRFDLVCRLLLE